MDLKSLNLNTLIRSGVVLLIGAPLSFGVLANVVASNSVPKTTQELERVQASLTEPCVRYIFSKNDSKLERDAKNEIDDIVGGEVAYTETCKWVLS